METTERASGQISVGLLEVDPLAYQAWFAGRDLNLSRSQIELLALLISNRQRVLSRDELAEALGLARGRSVDVMLTALRRILDRDFVRNVRGRGWILVAHALEV